MVNHDGKIFTKNVCMCTAESLRCIAETGTILKSTTFQLKNRERETSLTEQADSQTQETILWLPERGGERNEEVETNVYTLYTK